MGVRHVELPIHGVQFHPESILTEGGHRMLANWLGYCGQAPAETLVHRLEQEVADTVRHASAARDRLRRADAATGIARLRRKAERDRRPEVHTAARCAGSGTRRHWCADRCSGRRRPCPARRSSPAPADCGSASVQNMPRTIRHDELVALRHLASGSGCPEGRSARRRIGADHLHRPARCCRPAPARSSEAGRGEDLLGQVDGLPGDVGNLLRSAARIRRRS